MGDCRPGHWQSAGLRYRALPKRAPRYPGNRAFRGLALSCETPAPAHSSRASCGNGLALDLVIAVFHRLADPLVVSAIDRLEQDRVAGHEQRRPGTLDIEEAERGGPDQMPSPGAF